LTPAQLKETVQNQLEKNQALNKQAQFKNDLERIAQVMYAQNLTLVQINRTLSILRAIDLIILESNRDLKQLSNDISKAIISASPYEMVAILSLNSSTDNFINFQGWAINPAVAERVPQVTITNLLSRYKVPLDSEWISGPKRNLIIDFQNLDPVRSSINVFSKVTQEALLLMSKGYNLRSIYLTKLKASGKLTGFMVVGIADSVPHLDDIELIERLSESTGIALYNRLLLEENQNVLEQLKQTNDKLKEIDEAKDEFISMASHQLRTPLTSMKGYVSMVLDGEAGTISNSQRSMLQQAFNSSQRMVYLISDLLNVSRIRTGKFLITNKVTDLPTVVEGEVSQLSEVAASRNIRLIYDKPTNFPLAMLDETKIRQVIMNFLDNALYYTPKGGRITVELKATDNNIEYIVTDTGLGVSKADQPLLFTKFYRANNARKMRPDGTGLGLYMARKIIVAQGGAIIFNSIEGEGSVFGFSFSRDKVAVKPYS